MKKNSLVMMAALLTLGGATVTASYLSAVATAETNSMPSLSVLSSDGSNSPDSLSNDTDGAESAIIESGVEQAICQGTKDQPIVGTCYTIDGTYIAGSGSGRAGDMPNNGVKMRINQDGNRIVFAVNEGYTITDFMLCAVSNQSADVIVTRVEVDSIETAFTGDAVFPSRDNNMSGTLRLSDINAKKSIAVYLSSESATQINAYYELSWAIIDESKLPDPELPPFSQSYDEAAEADWSSSVSGRYTPVVSDGYLTVNQDERKNNGCVLTSTMLAGHAPARLDFTLTFDAKLSNGSNQVSTFTIYDAANANAMLSLTATGAAADTWSINGTSETVALPNSSKCGSKETIDDVTWVTVKLTRFGELTFLTILNRETAEPVYAQSLIAGSSAKGGLGKMEFKTGRYYANFAIDNINVRAIEDGDVPQAVMTTCTVLTIGADSLTLREPVVFSGVAGSEVKVPDALKAPFYSADSTKYYLLDSATSLVATEDSAQNIVTLKFREAGWYTYALNATYNAGFLTCVASGADFESKTIDVPYSYMLNVNGRLYKTTQKSTPAHYVKNMTLAQDGQQTEIAYEDAGKDNVVFFAEAENIPGMLTAQNDIMKIRSSNAACGYATEKTAITRLPAGTYILGGAYSMPTKIDSLYFFADDAIIAQVAPTGRNNWINFEDTVKFSKTSQLYFRGGNSDNGLDFLYIQQVAEASTETLADIAALKNYTIAEGVESADVVLTLNAAKVTYARTYQGYDYDADRNEIEVEKDQVVIEDASAAYMIENSGLGRLVATGQTLNGRLALTLTNDSWAGMKATLSNGLTDVTVTDGTAAPMVITESNVDEYSADYDWRLVRFNDVTMVVSTGDYGDEYAFYTDLLGDNISMRDSFGLFTEFPAADTKVSVTGFLFTLYGMNIFQPLSIENETATPQASLFIAEGTTLVESERVGLPISIESELPIKGLQFDVVLPEGMTLGHVTLGQSNSETHTVSYAVQDDGSVRVVAFSLEGETFDLTEAAVVNVNVSVAEGTYAVTLKNVQMTTADYHTLKPADQVFTVTVVSAVTLGDVNADGMVNVTDAVLMIDYILGNQPSDFNEAAADVNADGTINVTDVVMVIDAILGNMTLQPSSANTLSFIDGVDDPMARTMTLEQDDIPGTLSLALTAAAEPTAVMALSNATPYTAFQADVTLPLGMTLEGVTLTERAAGSHVVRYSQTSERTWRVIAVSMQNETFAGNSGSLLNLRLEAAGQTTGAVSVSNAVFVTPGCTQHDLAAVSTVGETTGIRTIDNLTISQFDNCYTLGGQKADGQQRKGMMIKNGRKFIVR